MDERAVVAWERAARRALATDLPGRLRRRGAAVLVPSCREDGGVYHVRLRAGRVGACDCPAGLAGRPCKHAAAALLRLYEREAGVRVVGLKGLDAALLRRYLVPRHGRQDALAA